MERQKLADKLATASPPNQFSHDELLRAYLIIQEDNQRLRQEITGLRTACESMAAAMEKLVADRSPPAPTPTAAPAPTPASTSASEMEREAFPPLPSSKSDEEASDLDGFEQAKKRKKSRGGKKKPSTPAAAPTAATATPAPSSSPADVEMRAAEVQEPTAAVGASVETARPAKRPPPIVLRDKTKWSILRRMMMERRLAFEGAKSIGDGVSFTPATVNDYRSITNLLKEQMLPYHSFMFQEEKPLKVVIRGVMKEIPTEEVAEDLRDRGFPVVGVARLLGRGNRPCNLVLVSLRKTEKAKDIFQISNVLGLAVKLETPRKKKGVAQCHRCQRFNHGQRCCEAPPRCVKCGEEHLTRECPKPREEPAKCANCGESHPASYRGCKNFPKPGRPQQPQQAAGKVLPARPAPKVTPGVSFAAAVTGPRAAQATPSPTPKASQESSGINEFMAFVIQNEQKMPQILDLLSKAITGKKGGDAVLGLVNCLPLMSSLAGK